MPGIRDLPSAKGKRHIKALQYFGWLCTRTTGSHHILEKQGVAEILSIPCGGKDVNRLLLKGQLDVAGISIQAYCLAFKKGKAPAAN